MHKFLVTLGLLLAAAPPAPAIASDWQPIRPLTQCLDPSRVRSFQLRGNDRLLIDAGRQHFMVELSWACPSLQQSPTLRFAGRNPGGRICGDIGEVVFAAERPAQGLDRCGIARVTAISADEFRAELEGPATAEAPPR